MARRCNSPSSHTFAKLFSSPASSHQLLLKLVMATMMLLVLLPSTLDAASIVRTMDCHLNYKSFDWMHPCGNSNCSMSAPTQNGKKLAEMLEHDVILKSRELIRKYEETRITDKTAQSDLKKEFINSQQVDGSFGKRLENVTELNASDLGHLAYELLSNLTVRVDIAHGYEQNSTYPITLEKDFKDLSDQLHNVLCQVIRFVGKCGRPDAVAVLGLNGVNEVCFRAEAEYTRASEASVAERHTQFDYKVMLAVESVGGKLKEAFASARH